MQQPVTVGLSGTGASSSAAATITPSTLTFSAQPLGTTASAQVTLSNTGKSALTVQDVSVLTPQFTTSSTRLPLLMNPGQSTTIQVQYSPTAVTTDNGLLTISYSELPSTTVPLTGTATGVPSGKLAVTSLSVLPGATQSAPYSATLTVAGGKAPYSWSLSSGRLPNGLTLSKGGVIGGSVQSRVAAGTYTFSLRVRDSSPSQLSDAVNFTLGVSAPTGANCINTSIDIGGTLSPLTPIDQLGVGKYLGYTGGLYLNGSNIMPVAHLNSGISIAKSIQPLDTNGNPSSSGKYVLLSLGESNPTFEFADLLSYASYDPSLNPNLVMVQGAQPQETASALLTASGTPGFMNNVLNYTLPYAGVSAK